MKKIMTLLMLVAAMLMIGCSTTDTVYGVAKAVYVGGKTAVGANTSLIPDETLEKLKKVDAAATAYDKTRAKVRQALDVEPDK